MSYTKDELTFSWDVEAPLTIYEANTLKTPQFKIPKSAIETKDCSEPAYNSGIYILYHFIFLYSKIIQN